MTTSDDMPLPVNLPDCACFTQHSPAVIHDKCSTIANHCHMLVGVWVAILEAENMCTKSMPYFLELLLVALLTSITKTNYPKLEYGSEALEAELEKFLSGLEDRVRVRSRDIYKRGRDAGLTEEVVMAMRERDENEGGLQ